MSRDGEALPGRDAEEDKEDRIYELVAEANAMAIEARQIINKLSSFYRFTCVFELKKGHEPWCRISNVLHLVWKC